MEMHLDNPCDQILPAFAPQGDLVRHNAGAASPRRGRGR